VFDFEPRLKRQALFVTVSRMDIPTITQTPWGSWEVLLEAPYCKVKRLIVNAGQRLSYQKHFKREERWTVVLGAPAITLDGITTTHAPGDVITIPREALHRIANPAAEPAVLIEVQLGSYFGEDDIIRVADDYQRVS
jgi:mannose-6-phosphate isomerase